MTRHRLPVAAGPGAGRAPGGHTRAAAPDAVPRAGGGTRCRRPLSLRRGPAVFRSVPVCRYRRAVSVDAPTRGDEATVEIRVTRRALREAARRAETSPPRAARPVGAGVPDGGTRDGGTRPVRVPVLPRRDP